MFDLETNISIPLALYLVAVAKVTSHSFFTRKFMDWKNMRNKGL
jgi:hypothetical protein